MSYWKVTINGHNERRFLNKDEAEHWANYWGEEAEEVIGDINVWKL